MKNVIYYTVCLFFIFFSCKEEYRGQYPIDGIAPLPISNPQVENLPGKVKITYELPNETDLLYVKAIYKNTKGETMEEKSSVFKNELEIPGFGKSRKQTIQLITVDGSQNMSAPVDVEIEPKDSPIYGVFESIDAKESWGGFVVRWKNPEKEQLIMKVFKEEEDEILDLETFYSKEAEAKNSVRGLDTFPQRFSIYIKDIYENYTDTLHTTLTPLFEVELPSKDFKEMPLPPGRTVSGWSGAWSSLFDKNVGGDNKYYLNPGDPNPYFTIDLGAVYKLSRTRVWPRVDYCFALHNPRYFEYWGTTDLEAVKDPANWDGWTMLMKCESHKPSGTNTTSVTAEDKAYALAGEEYEFPDDVILVRYIRFRCTQTWTKTTALHVGELRFWGREEK